MATAKQIAANRTNAKKSTGPKSEDGKQRAKLNALRHGFTGQVNLMPEEDREALNRFCGDLNPANPMEQQLAQSIAHDHWRLNRMRAIEDNILALGHTRSASEMDAEHPEIHAAITAARVFSEDPHQFQLLTLYIQRTNREIHRNMQLLRELQAERRANRLADLEQAARLKQLLEAKGLPYDPATQPEIRAVITGDPRPMGFVFSSDEIEAFTLHQRLQKQSAPSLMRKRAA